MRRCYKNVPSVKNYIKIGQQTQYYINYLKYSPPSGMHAVNFFHMFHATRWRVSSLMCEIHSWIFCLTSSTTINVQWKKSSGVRYGDLGGHELREKEFAHLQHSWIYWMCHFLLQPIFLFVSFQHGYEIQYQFWVTFCCYCFSEQNESNYSPLRDPGFWAVVTVPHGMYWGFQGPNFCCFFLLMCQLTWDNTSSVTIKRERHPLSLSFKLSCTCEKAHRLFGCWKVC
jgi:hypothetical protein